MTIRSFIQGASLTLFAFSFAGSVTAGELMREGEHSAAGYKTVAVNVDVADIEITGTDNDAITWRLKMMSEDSSFLFWKSEGLKPDALQEIQVEVNEAGETLSLSLQIPEKYEDHNINFDWTIQIPRHLYLDIETDVGDVDIRNMAGGANIVTDVGDVEAEITSGGVDVQSDVGDVAITIQTGDVTAKSDVGDIEIDLPAAALSKVDLVADVGDIDVEVAGEKIPAVYQEYGPGGELEKDFAGTGSRLQVRTDVGDIEVTASK